MIALTLLLLGVGLGLLVLLGVATIKADNAQQRDQDHSRCVVALTAVVSRHHDAALLRALAEKWDSPDEQGNLKVMARERYQLGGPSMPSIWLRQQADTLAPDITTPTDRSMA